MNWNEAIEQMREEGISSLAASVNEITEKPLDLDELAVIAAEVEGFHRQLYGDEGINYPLSLKANRLFQEAAACAHFVRKSEALAKENKRLRAELLSEQSLRQLAEGRVEGMREAGERLLRENAALRGAAETTNDWLKQEIVSWHKGLCRAITTDVQMGAASVSGVLDAVLREGGAQNGNS